MNATITDILNSHLSRRAVIAGILNVTPDSFSDGGKFFDPAAAIDQARRMVADGADIIDVGAESTRPGSQRVAAAEQIRRLEHILPAVARCGAVVSVDTTLAEVAAFALDVGAGIINDISAGRDDCGMFPLVAGRGCPIILMHMLGQPATMQQEVSYTDVVGQVRQFLAGRAAAAIDAGIARDRIILDPGIGFGKLAGHNLALLAGTGRLADLGYPLMIGASRKRFIGELTNQPDASGRAAGTIGACIAAWGRGATIFRVHDVRPLRDAIKVVQAIEAQA